MLICTCPRMLTVTCCLRLCICALQDLHAGSGGAQGRGPAHPAGASSAHDAVRPGACPPAGLLHVHGVVWCAARAWLPAEQGRLCSAALRTVRMCCPHLLLLLPPMPAASPNPDPCACCSSRACPSHAEPLLVLHLQHLQAHPHKALQHLRQARCTSCQLPAAPASCLLCPAPAALSLGCTSGQ